MALTFKHLPTVVIFIKSKITHNLKSKPQVDRRKWQRTDVCCYVAFYTTYILIACSRASARDAFSEYFILRLIFLSLNHKYQCFECLKLLFMHTAILANKTQTISNKHLTIYKLHHMVYINACSQRYV